jgi:hypothetical protein
MTEVDPLEELYVDSAEVNKKRLSKALSGIIGIDRDAGKTVILEKFSDLNQSQKVFAYLLSRRVAYALDHVEESELGLSAAEIEKETGIPQGTIRRYCSESRLVESDDEKGGYVIPSYAISQSIDKISGD